jgi:hypothetical protein
LPDDDITGFTTHGIPIFATAALKASNESANAYGEVASRAPRRRAGGCPRGSS